MISYNLRCVAKECHSFRDASETLSWPFLVGKPASHSEGSSNFRWLILTGWWSGLLGAAGANCWPSARGSSQPNPGSLWRTKMKRSFLYYDYLKFLKFLEVCLQFLIYPLEPWVKILKSNWSIFLGELLVYGFHDFLHIKLALNPVDPLVHKVCISLNLFWQLLELFTDQPHQIFVLITF